MILLLLSAVLLPQIQSSGTESYIVLKAGQVADSYQPTKPVHIQGITQPFVSLATGLLVKEGKLKSIDTALVEILPELKQDPKAPITLRHLLTHSSGIRDTRNDNTADYLSHTLKLPIDSAPGNAYRYNNSGVMLLSAALERIAGEPLHLYLNRTLFKPLNITSASWRTDTQGRCPFYFGLTISAEDLAKIGQLILNDGHPLLTPEWIKTSTATPGLKSSERAGMLWFFQPSIKADLKPVMIQHSGDGGNWLVVFPQHNIVAVRLRTNSSKPDTLNTFPNLIVDHFLRP